MIELRVGGDAMRSTRQAIDPAQRLLRGENEFLVFSRRALMPAAAFNRAIRFTRAPHVLVLTAHATHTAHVPVGAARLFAATGAEAFAGPDAMPMAAAWAQVIHSHPHLHGEAQHSTCFASY